MVRGLVVNADVNFVTSPTCGFIKENENAYLGSRFTLNDTTTTRK